MAIDYAAAAALAERLITENGRSVTLVKHGTTPSDPSAPWDGPTTASETTVAVTAVFLGKEYSQVPISTSAVNADILDMPHREADKVAWVSYNDAATDISDYHLVRDGSTAWRILSVSDLTPGSTKILFQLELAK